MHRLWYDLRNQSLFDDAFRDEVREIDQSLERMIWRVVSRYAELAGAAAEVPSATAYALFDGLFLQGLLRAAAGSTDAAAQVRAGSHDLLGTLVSSG